MMICIYHNRYIFKPCPFQADKQMRTRHIKSAHGEPAGQRRGNQHCASGSLCSPFDKGIQTQLGEPTGAVFLAASLDIR